MEELYQKFIKAGSVSIDTRSLKPGEIFFALRGEKYDANLFVDDALSKGASLVVTQNPDYRDKDNCYYCEDSLIALQELAKMHRNFISAPVIGITGTNGKTTTKELCGTALSCAGNTFATQGNLNNHIGVPLSILSVKPEHEFVIIEMGANHIGEIETLCNIADPDYGLITNIGKAHLEGFGSYDGVIQAKTELYRYIQSKNGKVFVNEDDPLLLYESEGLQCIFYGSTKYAVSDFPLEILLRFKWEFDGQEFELNSQLTGGYNLSNFLAAISVGLHFGAKPGLINKALSEYTPVNKRSQVQKTDRNTLVVDAYNANPSSMGKALDNFSGLKANKKILILGDMLELGQDSEKEHAQILLKALALNADMNVFIGTEFHRFATDNPQSKFFKNVQDAVEYLNEQNISGALILIKGSRGIRCENVIPVL